MNRSTVEPLERRTLLATSSALLPEVVDGTARVVGASILDDTIHVTRRRPGVEAHLDHPTLFIRPKGSDQFVGVGGRLGINATPTGTTVIDIGREGRRKTFEVEAGEMIDVDINGILAWFPAAEVRRVHVDAGSADDRVEIDRSLRLRTTLIGARGNDTLAGGTMGDTISGGAGDDFLFAGAGTAIDFVDTGPSRDTSAVTPEDTNLATLGQDGVIGRLGSGAPAWFSSLTEALKAGASTEPQRARTLIPIGDDDRSSVTLE